MAFAGEIGWLGKSCPDHSGIRWRDTDFHPGPLEIVGL
jgi:hypothetical protein